MFVTSTAHETLRQRRLEEFSRAYVQPLLREAADLGLTMEDVTGMIQKAERS